MPSPPIPSCDWKVRTAVWVAGPKAPSTESPAPRLALSSDWTAFTAGPLSPWRTVMASAPQVAGPTMPSAVRPLDCWKLTTALRAPEPKTPSTLTD